jgi:ABC-type transport system substrate-binding protein
MDAEDVRFSLERAQKSPTRSLARAALGSLESIQVVGSDLVVLRTREPDASLLSRLREVPILSRRCLQQKGEAGLEATSCGSGPYQLAAHEAGAYVDLKHHQRYWGGAVSFPLVRFVARSYGSPDLPRLIPPGSALVFFAPAGAEALERASREAVPTTAWTSGSAICPSICGEPRRRE